MAIVRKPKLAYSVAELQKELGLGRNTISSLLNSGELQGKRVGRRWIVPASSVKKFLSELG